MSAPGLMSGLAASTAGDTVASRSASNWSREVVEAHPAVGAAEHPAAVQLIRAGLGHHVEDEAAARRLGRIVPRQEIAFGKRVRIEIHRGAVSLAVEARHVHAVDVIAALVVGASHRDTRLQERFRSAHVDFADDDARNHPRDRPDVHAVGQRLEHFLREHRLLQRREVSSSGASPLTTMPSSIVPISSRASARDV